MTSRFVAGSKRSTSHIRVCG